MVILNSQDRFGRTRALVAQGWGIFDQWKDAGSPVNDADYQPPFNFTGKLNKVTLTIDRPKLSPEDVKKLEMAQRNNRASE